MGSDSVKPVFADTFDASSRRRLGVKGLGAFYAQYDKIDFLARQQKSTARRLLKGSVSGHATSSSGSRSSSFHSSTSSSSASSSSRSSSNGWSSFRQPVTPRHYVSSHVSQARGFNTGGGYAFHATPVRFTRPMFLGAGTTFILLHHGNRNGYGRGYNSHCATAGCALETDAPLAADEFLDASLEVHAGDFPLTLELLDARLDVTGAEVGKTPLLLFGFQPL
mmetsp:Transcript_21452/g.50897  ORF Transcript_21452/g.50897 Transcript_21452/m.50897 type:complete len:222 (+) Transcript_21452:128-793(+)